MVMQRCQFPGCQYDTADTLEFTASLTNHLELVSQHMDALHRQVPQIQQQAPQARTEKFPRPKLRLVDNFISEEEWEFFDNGWKEYKRLANPGGQAKE
jgi:hypothetical protein